jgi:hypothetical protein
MGDRINQRSVNSVESIFVLTAEQFTSDGSAGDE